MIFSVIDDSQWESGRILFSGTAEECLNWIEMNHYGFRIVALEYGNIYLDLKD